MDGPVSNVLSTGEPGVAKVFGAAPRFHHPIFHHGKREEGRPMTCAVKCVCV